MKACKKKQQTRTPKGEAEAATANLQLRSNIKGNEIVYVLQKKERNLIYKNNLVHQNASDSSVACPWFGWLERES